MNANINCVGIIKESRIDDFRTPLAPIHIKQLKGKYPNIKFIVQPSNLRSYDNNEYEKCGARISEDLSQCDIIFGVKEIEPKLLLANKTYVFFSHTYKLNTDTLINAQKLRTLAYKTPIQSNAGLDVYKKPQEGSTYVLTADVSRGTKNDYSAFIVFDVTTVPYRIVAKFRDNEIKPLIFPSKIYDVARAYNQAFVLVEVNDIGEQVANTLQYDLEYDNLIMASMRGRAGQILGAGFSGGKAQLGVRTTKAVKRIGCSNLKQLIESDKLLLPDYDIMNELSTFIVKGSSWQADDGCTDDLVACLFIFAWAVDQTYFKELTDNDIRERMYKEQQNQLEQDMAPFGFVDNGIDNPHEQEEVDEYGNRWEPVKIRDFNSDW